jgi:hypothetical protein
MLVQLGQRYRRVGSDKTLEDKQNHLVFRLQREFGEAIDRVVQFCSVRQVKRVFQNDWLQPFETVWPGVFVEVRARRPPR